MNTKEAMRNGSERKIVELYIAGHPVTLSFAAEPDTTIAQRVRTCLIDSSIRQNVAGHRAA